MKVSCGLGALVALAVLGSTIASVNGLRRGCGVRKVHYNNLILGGQKAPAGKWPWHAIIVHRAGDTVQAVCGGSIIDKYTILTAAHCLYTTHGVIARNRLQVYVGRTQLSVIDDRSRSYSAERFIVHTGYSQLHVRDDIALIKVTKEIDMSGFIQPVCLWPSEPISGTDIVGRRGAVVGFGLTDVDKPSDVMLDAEVPVVDLWSCLESNRGAFGTHLARTMLCAGGRDGVGPCNGDSGGGLFLEIGGVWYVRGIVSFAPNLDGVPKCDSTQYTVFTDVAKYLDWIVEADGNGTLVSALRITNKPVAAQSMINSAGCGKESVQLVRERTDTNSFIFPWATTIEFVGIDYRRQNECLAYLITEWHLLTSATCVQEVQENEQEIFVRLGGFNSSELPKQQIRYVEKVIVHSKYSKQGYQNNLAILKLRKKAIIYDGTVNPICLPHGPHIQNDTVLSLFGRKKFFSNLENWRIRVVDNEFCHKKVVLPTKEAFSIDDGSVICAQLVEPEKNRNVLTRLPALLDKSKEGGANLLIGFLLDESVDFSNNETFLELVNVGHYYDWIVQNL
ncbi:prostasin [Anopheles gambiae]|uniref:prostasin n=1 Tax=Anopheles gambiae TaxID=7165 RepID=UPI002AC8D52E|nr:prostasin [Anopheles gambiae]